MYVCKLLLRFSKQFPAAPVNPPVIPSWQLKLSSKDEEEHKSESDDKRVSETVQDNDSAQKRIDLEENETPEDGNHSEQENDSPTQYSNVNGHMHNGTPENGIITPPAMNGLATNLHNTMLVSPTKLATSLNSSGSDVPQPVGGESELD